MEKPQFVYSVYIASTPEKVWEAITQGDFTEQYWRGSRIHSDWQVGSPVKLTTGNAVVWTGEVLECEPPRRLVYTFLGPWLQQDHPSRVRFEIEHGESLVKLTVIHDQLTETALKNLTGWPLILCSLKSFLESGRGLSFKNYF